MRFMILRLADADSEAGKMPDKALLEAMGAYAAEMSQAGILLGGEGLKASGTGARVTFRAGKPVVTDGPFTESKDLIAGYFMIQAKSKAEALDWLRRWPPLDGNGNVVLELRQVFEADDFGEAFTPDARAQEDRLRGDAAART